MCEPSDGGPLTRRGFLVLGGLGAAAGLLLPTVSASRAAAQANGVSIGAGHVIRPREVWGADLPPTGPMMSEAPGDVRFLLVHHSASPNEYPAEQSIRYLRSFYHYHTSAAKGWPDIAYNFLVDRHGQIFEGRQGSIESPIRGDATGGSQGFALLACFIGDHRDVEPTPAAQSAMVALLAWLADGYGIDPGPGATTEFVSRGSNLHPEGTVVLTPTITGHRTMSRTTCPGDQAFELVENSFPAAVTAALPVTGPASSSSPTRSTTAAATTTSTTSAPAQPVEVPEASIDIPPDTTSVTLVSPAPTAPSTIQPNDQPHEPSPPTSTLLSTHAEAEEIGVASPPTDPSPGSTDSRSRRILEKVWAGIATVVLGSALWLRRQLDPTINHTPEQ